MFSEYFIHFSIIILPLLVYQLWAFRKSFNRLPYATPIIGLYGGLTAVLSELFPIHIFGLAYDLKYIPLILAFLYGKRTAGIIALSISILYRLYAGHHGAAIAALSMVVYSILPFLLAKYFDGFRLWNRVLTAMGLSVSASAIQMGFVYVYYAVEYPGHGAQSLQPYLHSLLLGLTTQAVFMIPALILLDNIAETGKVRLQLLDSQQSLKESEEKYRSFIEYNPEGVVAFDSDGSFLFINRAYEQLSGYTSDELVGRNRLEFWFEDDDALAKSILQRVMAGEVVTNLEAQFRNKAGSAVPVRVTCLPSVVSGVITGFYVIATDLRPIRAAEEMIRKADKLSTVGDLAPSIAHEIRNPLTSLKGFLKLLKSNDSTTARYISVMEHEMDRIDFVSGQLLVLAKPQMERRRKTNLEQIINDIVVFMQSQALLASVDLTSTVMVKEALVMADANQLKQVFINFIKNAIEATPAQGKVTVTLDNDGNKWVVAIQDTGVGMATEVLKRLGEPFYTTKDRGTGLGLMVSHRIIGNHGGQVSYESQEHEGTTVTVQLPKYNAAGLHETERLSSTVV